MEAEQMVTRCVAEGVYRGFLNGLEDETRDQFLELARQMNADQSSDLLVGSEPVGMAGKDRLQWIAQVAIRRMYVLDGVISYLNDDASRELQIKGIETERQADVRAFD